MPPVKPIKYTGKRLIDFETLKIFGLRGQARWDAIAELNKAEERAKRRSERDKAKRAEARRMREQERARARIPVVIDITTQKIQDVDELTIIEDNIMRNCATLIGQTHAYLQVSLNGVSVVSELVNIKGKTGNTIYYESFFHKLFVYVGGVLINVFQNNITDGVELDNNDRIRLVILKADAIPAESIRQSYLDGQVHCVIEPLYNLWTKMANNAGSDASRKRCNQIANQIKALEKYYADGVPEEKMEEVAKMCRRCVIIHDIVGNEIIRYNKNSSHQFHFTNTRPNHLESGFITMDKNYEKVSQAEMNRIMAEHLANDEFYLITGDFVNGEPTSLRSAKGAWAVYNEDYEIYSEFSKQLGIKNYGIDAVKHSKLNEFVKEARLINSAPTPLCDEPNNIDGANHIDISKAYTQAKQNKYYQGFLGHIQQFRKLPFTVNAVKFLENHLGIYQFIVLSNNSELLIKLGIKTGMKYILPGPEILYFIKEFGVSVRLLAGCWGSSFDIEWTDEMLEQRRYCMWSGKLGMDNSLDTYTFKGNREWASHLKTVLGDDNVLYFSEKEMIVIKMEKKSYYTTHHILAGITSYTRLNMFDIMRKIDGKLIKVILDGIYFRGDIPDVEIPHKNNKDLKKHIGFRDAWYYPSEVDVMGLANYNADLDGSCVLSGAGGTGKSYSVLADKGFINPLYVVPSHILGRKGRESFGCNYTTIHKLIGEDCVPYRESHYVPGVIFIDELTMIDEDWIERAIKMYPNALMFIAGDIDGKQWFQCRNGCPGNFSKIWLPSNWRYVSYNVDMRSKDEELKAMKTDIRKVMREVFTDGGKVDSSRVNLYVKKNYNTVSFDEAVAMFQPGDYWIAGTHRTNEKLLERDIVSGYINKNKEIVRADEAGAIKRGAFTTHSFQGLTIDNERVFISLDFFEYAMLYTSISRVRNFNQIILVRN